MKVLHVFTLAITAESFFDGQFKYLSENGNDITISCSPDNRITEFAERNLSNYVNIEISRTLSPAKDLKSIRQLVKLIRDEHFDIVVGHTPKGALLSMLAARLAGCRKRVYFRHGLIYTTASGLKRRVLKAEERFVSSLATKIVNVSKSVGKVVVDDNINDDCKQLVIGRGSCGGIDTINFFNPLKIDTEKKSSLRQSLDIAADDFVIGFCGRLCNDKGIPELIEGFKLFRTENPDAHAKLLLIGGYDSRDILSDIICKEIKEDVDIIHVGHIFKDLNYYYALMNVFVFPSHREGFGMCSIEAQAMEVPVLVAKSHGCVDTILEHETGLYIDITPQSICSQLIYMLDGQKRIQMGRNAREFVCDNFERTKFWPVILDFYNHL